MSQDQQKELKFQVNPLQQITKAARAALSAVINNYTGLYVWR